MLAKTNVMCPCVSSNELKNVRVDSQTILELHVLGKGRNLNTKD